MNKMNVQKSNEFHVLAYTENLKVKKALPQKKQNNEQCIWTLFLNNYEALNTEKVCEWKWSKYEATMFCEKMP